LRITFDQKNNISLQMKSLIKILVIAVVLVAVSCKKDTARNYQFMPNMYESAGYETYGEAKFSNGIEAQLPAEGSIPRGYVPFDIENSTAGYNLAKANLKSPLAPAIPLNADPSVFEADDKLRVDYEKAGPLYTIYCAICHGVKGDGKGNLVKREKILGIPSYDDAGRAINEGSIYHTIYYGKNAMGSYANQLNEEERWQVVAYVLKLKADLEK